MLLAARYPDIPGGAVILPVEGRRWIVTLVGHRGDHPPLDEEGFLAFARGLAGPQVYDAIRQAEPISGISGYRRTENRWRHYARLARWPDGLIALGDAVCAFNPVYGQGMTVGALAAETLADVLAGPGEAGLGLAFQKRLAKMLQVPWQLATGDDFRWAGGAAGKSTLRDRLMHAYLEQVLARLHQPDVAHTFFSVTHLIQSPAALFRPGIAVPVLWRMLRGVPARQNAPAGAEPSAA